MSLLSKMKGKGPSGFGYGSTTDEVMAGMDLSGKTVLVTGVTSGLGLESARVLLARGARVMGTARTEARARAALAPLGGASLALACELGEPTSVRACVAAVSADCAARGAKLDVILCNAGIMALPRLEQAHGIELQFFTNHMGHFLLVTGLLDSLASDGRVVVVSSEAHRSAPRVGVELDNLGGARGYSSWRAYGQSKLANLLFARELARRFTSSGSARVAIALHPGVIATNLFRHMGPLSRSLLPLAGAVALKSVAEGAATQVFAAVHPWARDKSGAYLADCNIKRARRDADDAELARRLWAASEQIAGRI